MIYKAFFRIFIFLKCHYDSIVPLLRQILQEKKKNTFDAIVNSAGEIRRCLCSKMHIRYVPVLRFYEDSALEYGNKIDMILSTITYGENNDDN